MMRLENNALTLSLTEWQIDTYAPDLHTCQITYMQWKSLLFNI